MQFTSEETKAQRNRAAYKRLARRNPQDWTKSDSFPLPQTIHPRNKPRVQTSTPWMHYFLSLKFSPTPFSVCMNLSLLEVPALSLAPMGSLSLFTQVAGVLLNSKETHCLCCNRTLISSGILFTVHFHVPMLPSPPGCETLEGEIVPC